MTVQLAARSTGEVSARPHPSMTARLRAVASAAAVTAPAVAARSVTVRATVAAIRRAIGPAAVLAGPAGGISHDQHEGNDAEADADDGDGRHAADHNGAATKRR